MTIYDPTDDALTSYCL